MSLGRLLARTREKALSIANVGPEMFGETFLSVDLGVTADVSIVRLADFAVAAAEDTVLLIKKLLEFGELAGEGGSAGASTDDRVIDDMSGLVHEAVR